MVTTFLVLAGLFSEAFLAAIVLLLTRRDHGRLYALSENVSDSTALSDAIDQLPVAEREITRELVDGSSAAKTPMDELLVQALVKATATPFAPRFTLRALATLGIVALAFAPMVHGVSTAAGSIADTADATRRGQRALAFLEWQTQLEEPFAVLRDSFQGSALLLVGAALLSAMVWWQRRPEAKEARFVRALLELAARLRAQPIPAGARLAELIAPHRGLSRPVAASLIWAAAITFGWLFLQQTAVVRASNRHEPTFDVWPSELRNPVSPAADVALASAQGGSPIRALGGPSLEIGRETIRIQQRAIADLSGEPLPSDWSPSISPDQLADLRQFKSPLEISLLVDRGAPIGMVKMVMVRLTAQLQAAGLPVQRFQWVVERRVRFGIAAKVFQASMPVEINPPLSPPTLTMSIEYDKVSIGGQTLALAQSGWQDSLRLRVRSQSELLSEGKGTVLIEVSPNVSAERFSEVLATADSACLSSTDCGLPGLGLRFILKP